MTPADVAELLQVHLKTVYKLAGEGQLPGHRIGRSWRFSRAEVLKIFEPNKTSVLPES